MTHTTIIGAGPVGLLLATLLSHKCDVTLISRPGSVAGKAEKLIEIQGALSMRPNESSLVIAHSVRDIRPGLVCIATKAYDIAAILSEIRHNIGPDHTVVICSNGLGIYSDAQSSLPSSVPLLRCLCAFGVLRKSPHQVELSGAPPAITIAYDSKNESPGRYTSELFRQVGFEVCESTDIVLAEWEKAAMNCIINSVCTIVREKNGVLAERESLRRLCRDLLSELHGVSLADGVSLEHLTPSLFFERLQPYGSNVNSSLQDLWHGRASEMKFIIGRVLERAHARSIACPRLECLWQLLQALPSNVG